MNWKTSRIIRVFLALSLVPLSPLGAQQPGGTDAAAAAGEGGIQHDGPMCVMADEHARLTACFDAVVAKARLVFRGGGISNYYRIDMSPDDPQRPCVSGFLPKLKRRQARTHQGAARVQYYIETTRPDLVTARTRLFGLEVVDTPSECQGRLADSVPEAEVNPMPADPNDPPFPQAAQSTHWRADAPAEAPAEASADVPTGAPATAAPGKKGGGPPLGLAILGGAAALTAALLVPVGGDDLSNGGTGGSGSGSCSGNNQCANVGNQFCSGSANVRCGNDGLCHCCYTVNNRCALTCSSSNPCIDRNTTCVQGVCVFTVGTGPN
jgi:hypothetical protein